MPDLSQQAHAPASSNWEAFGETFYRKQELYQLQWSLADLSDHVVCGARWGGPVAVMRDDSKPVLVGSKNAMPKARISIFSSAGSLLQTIQWDLLSKIVRMGWTLDESLVVLGDDGTYRIYPMSPSVSSSSSGPAYTQHSLGSEAQDSGVIDAKISEDGMVVLLGSLSFIELKGWQRPNELGEIGQGKVSSFPNPGLVDVPSCWCVVPRDVSSTRGTEVLIGADSTVYRLDEIEVQDQRLNRGALVTKAITLSPDGHFLAILSVPESGAPQLWVVSADFNRSLSEFSLAGEGESGPPLSVVWCGSNTVVAAWEKTVVMVGPFGETLKYFYTSPVYLIGEIDGARIISGDRCDFLQKVPQSTQDVFRPGSASPAAILYEASELFDRKSPRGDELVRNIKRDLVGAVDTCIDAAGRELEVYWQKRLLKAASFGKTFLDFYNPSEFVSMSHTLRVLNAARFYEIGIPLTYDQYRAHPPARLIGRLTSRSHHLLSLRISSFLHLSPAPVLKHWAQAKIASARSSDDDDEICRVVVDKLKESADVSCADVAQTAWLTGKPTLATKLLEHEPRASKQVPLLLSMKEDNAALVKAIQSCDPDLVNRVILHLRRIHSLSNFFRFIDDNPAAVDYLIVYAKENDIDLLKDFYYHDDRWKDSALLSIEEAKAATDTEDRILKLKVASKSFKESKAHAWEAEMVDEQIRLLVLQQELEGEATGGTKFVGLSVNETIRACLVAALPKRADKIKSDWKVSDKRFWWIKLRALVELRDWEALETFAKSKKSPIGYEPFVTELVGQGSLRQAVAFVQRCEPRNRAELYVQCGEWIMAGQECVRRADRIKLSELRQRAPNSVIAAQLDKLNEEAERNGL